MKIRIIAAVLFLLAAFESCAESQVKDYDEAWNDGYEAGEENGYDEGKADGWEEGYDKGYGDGYDAGNEAKSEQEAKENNSYTDYLVYFEFPAEYELTYADPEEKEPEYLRAIIEYHGDYNDTGEYIAFARQDLSEFEYEDFERKDFTIYDKKILADVFGEENTVGLEIRYAGDATFAVAYNDSDGDKIIDTTEYATIKDGVLYQFIHVTENGEAESREAIEVMLETLALPTLEKVTNYYG